MHSSLIATSRACGDSSEFVAKQKGKSLKICSLFPTRLCMNLTLSKFDQNLLWLMGGIGRTRYHKHLHKLSDHQGWCRLWQIDNAWNVPAPFLATNPLKSLVLLHSPSLVTTLWTQGSWLFCRMPKRFWLFQCPHETEKMFKLSLVVFGPFSLLQLLNGNYFSSCIWLAIFHRWTSLYWLIFSFSEFKMAAWWSTH